VKFNFERWGETILGAIVAIVAVGFFAFAAAQAGQTGTSGGYDLTARFQRIDGISIGSDVRISGVKVGAVSAISMDPATFDARVTLSLDRAAFAFDRCAGANAPPEGCGVPDESTARVASDGLLGGAYIAIEPAGMAAIPPGGEILNTQGSVDLLTLFSSFARGQGDDSASAEEPAP
jgi:phospholipid/cholesterol/gamma-HCH transport system substrate-binding protein